MKVAINIQEENWQDDGGAHDPFIIDTDLLAPLAQDYAAAIIEAVNDPEVNSISLDTSEVNVFYQAMVQPPCMVDGVLVIWYSYD